MRHYAVPLLALLSVTGCCALGDCKDPELAVSAQATTLVNKPANVTVSFKVEDETGNGVASLKTDNFNIYEDDALVSTFEAKPVILPRPGRFSNYTIILLDLSGSITQSQSLPAVKTAATKFVQTVVPDPASSDVQVGIWWFDGAAQPHILVPFTTSRIMLTTAIAGLDGSMSADNSTNLNGAMVVGIDSAFERASADKARNVTSIGSVVLFTDGTDQAARVTESTVRTKITNTRGTVKVYSIGLGREVSASVLDAYGPDGYFQASDATGLADKFGLAAQRVKDNANSYYQLQYCSPKRAGTHELRIEAVFDKARGSLRTTFNADGFGGGCTAG